MCGFAGIFGKDTDKFGDKLATALELIEYRGPDAKGFYRDDIFAVGHNRLKIIDLSDQANQPFQNDEYVLAFNGEIYNYIEIKSKFNFVTETSSDSEVLFEILKKFNSNFSEGINLLNGMFAFSFYDKKKRRLILGRDRLGVKPLYYTVLNDSTIVFASEVKAILRLGLKFNINHRAVVNFLVNRTLSYQERTFFEKIYSVEPGSYIEFVFDGDKLKQRKVKYWDFPNKIKDVAFQEAVKKFREFFFDAVTIRLRADVPVATLLSGGLDSSAVTSAIAFLFPQKKIVSISAVYEGDPMCERIYAEKVIKKHKNIEPIWLNITQDMAGDILDNVIYHQETPIADGSMVSHFLLMRALKEQNVKVILSGQGGDEILGGYVYTFLPAHYADCLRRGNIKNINIRSLFHSLPPSLKNKLKQISICKNYLHYISLEKLKEVDDYYHKWNNQTILNNYLITSLRYWSLPGFLHYEDRNTMAYSLEGRGPFLDYRLVEFMLSLSNEFKINNGIGKFILRQSLKDILPQIIAQRKDKQAFYAPVDKWAKGVDYVFLGDDGFQRSFHYIKFPRVISCDYLFKWKLYTLFKWYKIFIKEGGVYEE